MFLFGRKPKPTAQEGIMRLREMQEIYDKREKALQMKIDQQLMTAKQNVNKNRRGKFGSIAVFEHIY